MRNMYRVLGVSDRASPDEIRRAYCQLARRYHPDTSGLSGSDAFHDIREAYETLGDEERRRAYDAQLASMRRHATVARDRRDWFDNDVAIDFLSIHAVVDRIREAFLGPDDVHLSRLSAEVLLTAREAFDGLVVPLAVPVRHVCTLCGGRGEVWAETCKTCDGSGAALARRHVRLSVPPGVQDGARISFSIVPPSAPATFVEIRVAIQ